MKWLKRLFKKKPEFKYTEGVDFHLVPDIQAAQAQDPHPWNIYFLGRIIKVHSLKIPDAPDENGDMRVAINAQVLYGGELTNSENQLFGELLMELVQRNMLEKD